MSMFTAPTMKDLQAVVASAGDAALVFGHSAPGDMGGGSFYLQAPPPDSATISNVVTLNAQIVGVTADSPTSPITITTSANHHFQTGQVVGILGVSAGLDRAWSITVTDLKNFTLDDSAGSLIPTLGSATASSTRITTSAPHGLPAGQSMVMIGGVKDNTAA